MPWGPSSLDIVLAMPSTAATGGASTADAPTLESGQYTDTISPGEELFYAVDLAEGQALGASVSSVGEIAFLGALSLTLNNPEQEFVADDAAVAGGETLQSISLSSETIGPAASDVSLQSGGTYYLVLELAARGEPSEEFPIEMVVEVTGDPVTPTPTEEPDPDPEESEDGPTTASGDDEAGGNGMMLALGGVAFGLLGAALGALGGRKLVGGR